MFIIHSRTCLQVLTVVVLGAVAWPPSPVIGGPVRPTALTDTDGGFGPGLGPNVFFADFSSVSEPLATPAINRAGESIFLASLVGTGIDATNDRGIWVKRGGILIMLARTGDHAPGTDPGVVFSAFHQHPLLSACGSTAFQAILSGPGVDFDNNDGFWTESAGTFKLIVRENTTPVPGGGAQFADPALPGYPIPRIWAGVPRINGNGHVCVRVALDSAPNTWGMYTDQSGTLQEIVRVGDSVPGINPPRTFINIGPPTFSDNGFVTFTMLTSTPFPQLRGLWTNRTGSLGPITMVGDIAPGTVEDFTRFSFRQSTSNSDRVAFLAATTGNEGFAEGIWSEGLFGVVQPIALTGSPAPGTTANFFSFGSLSEHPVVSDSGATAFIGNVVENSVQGRGVWSNRSGLLELVAGSGNPVPGLPGASFSDFFALAINATGDVSFFTTTSTGKAVCRQDPGGLLEVVASTFTPLDVFGDGTDIRLITDVTVPLDLPGQPNASSTSDGDRIAFNNNGDIVFRLAFGDGTEGIFTTSVASVPGDIDGDGDTDSDDYTLFSECMAGVDVTTPPLGCNPNDFANADLDTDSDVDLADFGAFLVSFTGPQ